MANIIITGTSRGIGFELAQLFADAGHQVLA
ncbi:MAG: short-chain dehydrogenase, partial [Pricia sp.]